MNGQSLDGSQSAGVVVLGSHRGGTSAVTEALAALGLHAGGSDGLKPGSDANQRGFWEVSALTRFNDRLLLDLGGAWDAPPAPGAGSSGGLEWRAEATELFSARLHPVSVGLEGPAHVDPACVLEASPGAAPCGRAALPTPS